MKRKLFRNSATSPLYHDLCSRRARPQETRDAIHNSVILSGRPQPPPCVRTKTPKPSIPCSQSCCNMYRVPVYSALISLALCTCSSLSSSASTAIFEQPQSYVGKVVKLCGYVDLSTEYTNIWPNEHAKEVGGTGLGVIYYGHNARALSKKVACLTGEIIRTGCKTDKTIICNWSNFDYAIRVSQ